MIPSYFVPRFISRMTNFLASSIIQRTCFLSSPEINAFSFAQVIAVFDPSTCVTSAPAERAANVAPPVYPKRFKILSGLHAFLITLPVHCQFGSCSGKTPVCLNAVGLMLNLISPNEIFHSFCILSFFFFQIFRSALKVASAFFHSFSGRLFFQRACGSGLLKTYFP